VSFCGDGANDCSALKAADVGLSLSQAEASIAAPFTSNVINISSIIILIQEGRAALSTSLSAFKYLCFYTLMQMFGLMVLYYRDINYNDYQYLYMDLFVAFALSIIMCIHGPYTEEDNYLSKEMPDDSLISFDVIFS
jgi:cation-transporting P-type ATPase 13A2